MLISASLGPLRPPQWRSPRRPLPGNGMQGQGCHGDRSIFGVLGGGGVDLCTYRGGEGPWVPLEGGGWEVLDAWVPRGCVGVGAVSPSPPFVPPR